MTVEDFKQSLSKRICPFCKKRLKYYDGALGYEAMRCYDCGFEIDNNGMGFFDNKQNCSTERH